MCVDIRFSLLQARYLKRTGFDPDNSDNDAKRDSGDAHLTDSASKRNHGSYPHQIRASDSGDHEEVRFLCSVPKSKYHTLPITISSDFHL